ncbi:MAG: hypothetical protein A3B31_00165 [Candidatus Komeilibacteria bacterium RIFCSPLOWO2_01_FULL_53_11]|uniref:Phosphoribulokinase/uridine kinase domain-containing protein n=1 Tax=Candidatus Komeilibacteria bacterium RIFCSPLOWO2_01_FULL_53_11 TaxID=1798552 RepID=A0A1G2BT04_9BACT|nr:MAG: hypothetical protein A3B31_00165 [Candidatus Komeilibacteria bacterium RIFCSPLOWO2_01_FULL_53_11]
MTARPFLIALTGPSGSGKTSVARLLAAEGAQVSHIRADDFYKDYDTFPKMGGWINWDVPENIDFEALRDSLEALRSGKPVHISAFIKDSRERTPKTLSPSPVLLVEGFLLLYDASVRDLFDLKIYIDCPREVQIERRLQRDKIHPREHIEQVVIPQYEKYGLPTRAYADHVVSSEGDLDATVSEVRKIIADYLKRTKVERAS